ncbi:ATP-dependent DNA helicase sgs1 [Physocladia obscura]|uniref:DNA 3'-5' helicase n=1 Tax=Physocladia obscura TaxID=109957 RepID=A0AAD5SRA2_9FUNG|nr:ATP-dependent DNA helicase sgs1 [Physocladia obscura]
MDIYRGSKGVKIIKEGLNNLELYGVGASHSKTDVERIFRELVVLDIIREESVWNRSGYANSYAKMGNKAMEVLQGRRRVLFNFPKDGLKLHIPSVGTSGQQQQQQTASSNQTFSTSPAQFSTDKLSNRAKPLRAEEQPRKTVRKRSSDTMARGDEFEDDVGAVDSAEIQALQQQCFNDLKKLRTDLGAIPLPSFDDRVLTELSRVLPQSSTEFKLIPGVDAAKFDKFGRDFLQITRNYADSLEVLRASLTNGETSSKYFVGGTAKSGNAPGRSKSTVSKTSMARVNKIPKANSTKEKDPGAKKRLSSMKY